VVDAPGVSQAPGRAATARLGSSEAARPHRSRRSSGCGNTDAASGRVRSPKAWRIPRHTGGPHYLRMATAGAMSWCACAEADSTSDDHDLPSFGSSDISVAEGERRHMPSRGHRQRGCKRVTPHPSRTRSECHQQCSGPSRGIVRSQYRSRRARAVVQAFSTASGSPGVVIITAGVLAMKPWEAARRSGQQAPVLRALGASAVR
jgi:hypothetical protein